MSGKSTPNAPAASKKSLRSSSSSFALCDIEKLIAESEERIINHVNKKFSALTEKVGALEEVIKAVKAVQVQQESDIERIKEIVVTQQHQIEMYEEKERRCNVIISNLPESDVSLSFAGDSLDDDESRTLALANAILPQDQQLSDGEILEVARIGERRAGHPRILKVKLSDSQYRNNLLRSCRNLNLPLITNSFGRIFINRDMSYLRRQEEKRLREKMKELKHAYPDANVRLRNGKLLLGPGIKDRVDFRNLLF